VASDLEPTWVRPDAAVVGLNTARRARLKFDWSLGSLSRRQIAGLGARFRPAAKSAFRIVVAHHPFLEDEAAATPQRPQVMVKRARRALEAFHREGVDLVLAGHLHRTYAARFSGPPSASAVVAQDRVRGDQVTVIQAGTALSYRTRGERNSFNRIEIDGPVLSVHTVVWSGSRWDRAEEPLVVLDRRDRSAAAAGVAGLPLGGLPR
jgi:3',5'-cyclic AMP phosphodiesterase CpdA